MDRRVIQTAVKFGSFAPADVVTAQVHVRFALVGEDGERTGKVFEWMKTVSPEAPGLITDEDCRTAEQEYAKAIGGGKVEDA